MCWLMLGCVAFSVYCHAASADKCKIRLICVLSTALDLAAAALRIESGIGESLMALIAGWGKAKWGYCSVRCVTRSGGFLSMGFD